MLSNLDIIGFASTLETPTLPRVLPPVFRVRTAGDLVLLPPFSIQYGQVWMAHESNLSEFEELTANEKLTKLPDSRQAMAGYDLWVDPEGDWHYQPKAEVKKAFEHLYKEHLELAEKQLANKNYATACRHAAVARAVDPGKLDPLIIRGVAERALGANTRYEFTKHIAADILEASRFEQLIRDRETTPRKTNSSAYPRGAKVMQGISTKKPRLHTHTAKPA